MRAEQTASFFGCMSCNCSAAELAALSQPLVCWLVDSPPSPHAPPRLASPSRRERGECSAAEGHQRRRLRVRRRPAPSEPTGPRHRGRLAGDRPKKRNCAFTRSNSSRNLDFLNAFASPLQVAKRSNCAFSTVRGQRLSPAVDNDSLEVTTSTRSRTRSSRRDGRCACHARPSTRRDGWTSRQRHRVALFNKNSRHGSTMCIRTTAHTCYCRRRYTI